MFLDLKDGAKIVSLKPFVPEGFRMNESNVSSAISLSVRSRKLNPYSAIRLLR